MTTGERIFAVLAAIALPLAFALPVELVETGAVVELMVIAVVVALAARYISRVGRVARSVSEYLWMLVRRNKRVAAGFSMLVAEALASGIPRVLAAFDVLPDGTVWISRPWGLVWLVIALNLFAVGVIDDALQMHADQRIPEP